MNLTSPAGPFSRGRALLTRRLSLKLLAPTLVVSVLLVVTCGAGALYINHLHVDLSRELAENLASELAARKLRETVKEMVHQLRNGTAVTAEERPESLETLNRRVREQHRDIRNLANLEGERELEGKIAAGLDEYFRLWIKRERLSAGSRHDIDRQMARLLRDRVLAPCEELSRFNNEQVKASDRANSRIVQRLTWGLLAAGIAAPLSGLLLGYAMARGLYQSICQLSVRIRDAAGRLNRDLALVTLEDINDLPDLHREMQGVVEEIERVVDRLQQSERAVLRSEQLAAVGQVAAGVAHELRNPLTSIKMLVQTGQEGPRPAGLPPEDLAIIEHEVRRMEACIQTFLDFARPPGCERRRADLLAVVRRALALVEGRARRQKVFCKAELAPGTVELFIDTEQVHQVLVNLLLNALDALPQGGLVQLSVRDERTSAGVVTVRVQDDGPGIPPRVFERLFEPFVSSKETGLGLGLSICQRLVEAHGGTITGENLPEGGAAFTFTLPG
jgi:signal transduction histidine kinase